MNAIVRYKHIRVAIFWVRGVGMGKKHIISVLLLFSMTCFFIWSEFFETNEWMRLKSIILIQFILGVIVLGWHVRNLVRSKEHPYWILMVIAALFSVSGTSIWMKTVYVDHQIRASTITSLLWALSSLLYLTAIVYQVRQDRGCKLATATVMNLILYMVTAISITYYYIVGPLYELNRQDVSSYSIIVLFQLVDILLVFFIILLVYSRSFERRNTSFTYLFFGVLLLVGSDFLFALGDLGGKQEIGGRVDITWTFSLLMIGLSSYFYPVKATNRLYQAFKNQLLINREFVLPYTTIFCLMTLYMQSTHWHLNSLGIGLMTTFLLVIIRQTIVVLKNDRLTSRLWKNVHYDEVTQLKNKIAAQRDITKLLNTNQSVALLLIQLRRYKLYADAFGEGAAQEILREATARMNEHVKAGYDVLYRVGDTEFLVVLRYERFSEIEQAAANLLMSLKATFHVQTVEAQLTANIGISYSPAHGHRMEELHQYATEALYESQKQGVFKSKIYDTDMQSNLLKRVELESYLKNAIKHDELSVHYQPKVSLQNETVVGMEALVRWSHPKRGFVSPAEFIPIAEESGFINDMGEWVLRRACEDLKKLQDAGYNTLALSVNVSLIQFQNPSFPDLVALVLEETGVNANVLELEITESIVQNLSESTIILKKLMDMGVRCSIDDFGTGYSSLNVLEHLPIHTLKIDKSFVDRLVKENRSKKLPMAKTIIDMGLNLDLTIVAEGIEDIYQKETLRHYGCPIGQGYYFSRPLPFEELKRYLAKNRVQELEL